ncbi:PROTEIN SAR DEFICIENT 1 [Salix koriyanagi]|uniref:PROTEIN SAR DEFICIENT 1 n=1 Tax=Salix koriyanagi TaxID=2511006 RepID=A0A9Q0WD13_9ROSI|nr:PROTEIN SAR DEFICIENT 1 [Salix koriyanagi]
MAGKRFLDEPGSELDRPGDQKRMRRRPSFASVIGEAVMVNSLKNFCLALEPMLRRVVNEEMETNEEFNRNIVKERTGKRPLLAGDCLTVNLRDGCAAIGDIEFTDNSSWIRSRKFRLGVRVVPESYQGVRIREAITEAFVVKDHRGELYKKHHPPALQDEVWRLEKIGKDGAFHKKLAAARINTVQDFLKLSVVDPRNLKGILGPGMSEKMWEVAIKHARTCDLGSKHFVFRRPNCTITFNPICQIVHAVIDGNSYSTEEIPCITIYAENMVRQAYVEWDSLEEIVGISSDTRLLTQGEPADQYSDHPQSIVKSFQPTDHAYVEMGNLPSNSRFGYSN